MGTEETSKQVVDKVEVGEINHIILGFVRVQEEEDGQGINHMKESFSGRRATMVSCGISHFQGTCSLLSIVLYA